MVTIRIWSRVNGVSNYDFMHEGLFDRMTKLTMVLACVFCEIIRALCTNIHFSKVFFCFAFCTVDELLLFVPLKN